LYSVTLDLTGAQPTVVANSLKKVAANTRNVVGMGFQPGTGDFYFADNGMNEAAIGTRPHSGGRIEPHRGR
jgi:glucose/arabinose dehydrogenase